MPLNKEKQLVIKAISSLGRRVSAADIATKTGLPLNSATLNLNQVAAEAGGHLQVSTSGDIAYQFPIDYQTKYIAKGVQRVIEQLSRRLFEIAFFLLRISFGVMLILSLLVIVLTFIVIIFTASRSQNDDNDDAAFNIDFFDWMMLRELLFWNVYYPVPTYGGYDSPATRKSKKSNFLYNCFSFLFGDGNPNANLEERQWQMIAEVIRNNHGAVTLEQLVPYINTGSVSEDSMLPILVHFDGKPTVTESGNIVYLFPSLQATTLQENQANKDKANTQTYLKIFPWRFSQVEADSLFWVMLLASVNFLGSWWLYLHLAHSALSLTPILLTLVIYGTLFVAVPLLRYITIQIINARIEKGNHARKNYAVRLVKPDQKLVLKLEEANQMALTDRQIKNENLVYDTQKDLLEQEFRTINNA